MGTANLARAVETNLTALHLFLGRWPELGLHQDDDRLWTISEHRFSLCNVILDARLDAADADTQIERALGPYSGTNVNLMWKLGPSTRPADLGARLEKHGFLALPLLHGMVLDLRALGSVPPCPPELEVREVNGPETLNLWRQAVDRGFGWPSYGAKDIADNLSHFFEMGRGRPFTAFVAIIDKEPVSSSLAFFDDDIGGIYFVSTVPEFRRRGFGLVTTAAALIEARKRGCKTAILHATEMGYPVYRRLGFEEVCVVEMRLRLAPAML
jgi:GNAT superfamily N-acetyltransferase